MGIIIVGCLHGFSNKSFWKNVEHADSTTYNENFPLNLFTLIFNFAILPYDTLMIPAHRRALHQRISQYLVARGTCP